MRRRHLVASVGGAMIVAAAARAQQTALPVVGVLGSSSAVANHPGLKGFREGLAAEGYVEGKTVAIEYRWAEGQYDRLPAMAADLVSRRVTVIAALAGPATLAAKAATTTIPIVFYSGSDPVEDGMVESLHHPGGNLTGLSAFFGRLNPKRVQLLHELLPGAKSLGLLLNPKFAFSYANEKEVEAAVRAQGLALVVARAGTTEQLDAAFSLLAGKVEGLLITTDPFLGSHLGRLSALAAQYRLPTISYFRAFVDAGGLMSYGDNIVSTWTQVGGYTGRVLKGVRPADLPIAQPTKFELVINLKTAKALGLTVPPSILAAADEVIE
jgi:putative ABC transport system substrate-binding protein